MMRYRYNILVFLTTLLLYRVSCNNEEPNKDENEYGEARDLNGMDAAQTVSVGEKGLGLDTSKHLLFCFSLIFIHICQCRLKSTERYYLPLAYLLS